MMRVKIALICFCAVGLGIAQTGCSVSASASAGTRETIKGRDKILITGKKPPKRKAEVVGKKIKITEKVMFDTAKATIKLESHGLLNDVADVMREHSDIKRIRIEGHTDSDGSDEYNQELSQNRADSVMAFLVEAGIEDFRMEAVGYGEDRPIADNETEEGKEKNRRVEFNILEQGK